MYSYYSQMIVNINPKHDATFVTQKFIFLLKAVLDCFPFYVHIPANYAVVVISAFYFTVPSDEGFTYKEGFVNKYRNQYTQNHYRSVLTFTILAYLY